MSSKFWNAPDKGNIDQDNNGIESLLGAIIRDYTNGEDKREIYRETCGPSALEAALESLGVDQGQAGKIQPSDYYTAWMNTPGNVKQPGWTKPKNRYLEAYPLLLSALYPAIVSSVKYIDVLGKQKTVAIVREILAAPQSVALLLLKDPGHYIAALHIDERDLVTYNESWAGNYWNPGSTRKRTIGLASLVENLKYGLLQIEVRA
jgi:hypothetical protein